MSTSVPVYGLSIFDAIHLGIDENSGPVAIELMYRNLLVGGEPGSGKSVALGCILGHAALCPDVRLWLVDGKQVELGLWASLAERFVGSSMEDALQAFTDLQAEMDWRYTALSATGARKIEQNGEFTPILLVIDELAYFSATVGSPTDQKKIAALVRDLVARGRAAGIIVVAATQRPSADIIPTSLRDLFGYRLAFRCSTEASSDVIMGHGWANRGYCATDIDPVARGVGWLLAEGGIPRRLKTAYLSDDNIRALVAYGAHLRGQSGGMAA